VAYPVLRFGYLVNVSIQDCEFVIFLLNLHLQIGIGCVICSALEIIGGLGLSSRLIVSFKRKFLSCTGKRRIS
jgi:hypothetical protein